MNNKTLFSLKKAPRSIPALPLALMLLPSSVLAGAGANINVCVWLPTQQLNSLSYQVTVGRQGQSGVHCMNEVGHDASMTIAAKSSGLSCVSVGYAEEKGSGKCASQSSHWPVSYSLKANDSGSAGYSGSTDVQMWKGNGARLNSPSAGTKLCPKENLCDATEVAWDKGTQGPIYVIFQPTYK